MKCLLANLRESWETKKYIGISMDSNRDYAESEAIKELRNNLNVYNELRSKTKINIMNIPYKVLNAHKNEPIIIELKPTFLVKIFNNNSYGIGADFSV